MAFYLIGPFMGSAPRRSRCWLWGSRPSGASTAESTSCRSSKKKGRTTLVKSAECQPGIVFRGTNQSLAAVPSPGRPHFSFRESSMLCPRRAESSLWERSGRCPRPPYLHAGSRVRRTLRSGPVARSQRRLFRLCCRPTPRARRTMAGSSPWPTASAATIAARWRPARPSRLLAGFAQRPGRGATGL